MHIRRLEFRYSKIMLENILKMAPNSKFVLDFSIYDIYCLVDFVLFSIFKYTMRYLLDCIFQQSTDNS